MTRPPDANRMSQQQAARLDLMAKMGPREWEKKIAGLLRLNSWHYWRDMDRPRAHAKANAYRMAGMSDYIAWKHFSETPPNDLMKLADCYQTDVTIFMLIEAKTGRGRATEKQMEMLDAAKRCPGMAAYIARPERYDELVSLLGGEFGV